MTVEVPTAANSVHPRDIAAEDLARALANHNNPQLLRHLVELARRRFGFYPSHFPYTINQPWITERIIRLPRHSHILDIGAGVSPVPLYLAEQGMRVETVDNSRHMRVLPSNDEWNEWGFLDYGAVDRTIKSHHCDILQCNPPRRFDAIYSVAVLAHITRAARDETLLRCHEWLRRGGLLLLTIDIIPASDFLWNRAEGLEVESLMQHGTIEDVVAQLKRVGFRVNECRTIRTIYKSRTDLLLIACSKAGRWWFRR